jgi:hypothetical protein
MADPQCRTCGGGMVQKSPIRLFLVGLVMVASPAVAAFMPYLWAPAIILVLTGAYLIIWASFRRGYWCRECKKFSLLPLGRTGANPHAVADPGPAGKGKR